MSAASFALHPQLDADTFAVAELALCSVRLMNDATYPWLILVPRIAGARELIDLDEVQQIDLLREVSHCSRLLQHLFVPDKLNVAALGNMVPQLHVHVIARRRDDAAWPAPVWGRAPARPYTTASRDERLRLLQSGLATS